MRNSMKSRKQIAKKNSNVDIDILLEFERLNADYRRLIKPIRHTSKQGADYNISHPFERKYVSDSIKYLGANQKQ